MELKIENCNDKNFIDFLIKVLKQQIINSINTAKLYRLNQYINSLPDYKSKYRKEINCEEIIKEAVDNIKYYRYGTTYYIRINGTKKLKGLKVRIIDACKLINYGTIKIDGYPIFTQSLTYIEANLTALYIKYTEV